MMRWLIHRYDMLVYRLAYPSIRRICERNPGLAVMFQLWVNDWVELHRVSDRVRQSAREFYETLKEVSDERI